jgi:hypothetical protein
MLAAVALPPKRIVPISRADTVRCAAIVPGFGGLRGGIAPANIARFA